MRPWHQNPIGPMHPTCNPQPPMVSSGQLKMAERNRTCDTFAAHCSDKPDTARGLSMTLVVGALTLIVDLISTALTAATVSDQGKKF